MFESKYSKYVTFNDTRFAEDDEIISKLTPITEGAGVPLFEKDGIIYVDNKDNHSIGFGGTGCGKTRASCKASIRSIIANGENAIVNDPKGELFKATAGLARSRKYKINVLNLRNPEKSNRWNPLNMIYNYYHNNDLPKAQQAIVDFSNNLLAEAADESDRYWDTIASAFLSGLIEICLYCSTKPSHFTLGNILPLCSESSQFTVKAMLDNMNNLSEATKAAMMSVVGLQAEKTKSCIYSVLNTGLSSLIRNSSLLDLFSSNEIDFHEMTEKHVITYIIYPDEKTAMNNVVNTFLTQAYTAFLDVCNERSDDKLPIRMNFVLDEFSNLTPIENFDNRISESRSKNIRYHLFCQSMNQLSEKYGERVAQTILSNCTSWTCFSSKEATFLDYISRLCGNVVDYNGLVRPLISSSELQYLDKGEDSVEVLVLRQGVHPYVAALPYYDKVFTDSFVPPVINTSMFSGATTVSSATWVKLSSDYQKRGRSGNLNRNLNIYFGPTGTDD